MMVCLLKDALGPNGVMFTDRRSGQPLSEDSNGRFVPCFDNDTADYMPSGHTNSQSCCG